MKSVGRPSTIAESVFQLKKLCHPIRMKGGKSSLLLYYLLVQGLCLVLTKLEHYWFHHWMLTWTFILLNNKSLCDLRQRWPKHSWPLLEHVFCFFRKWWLTMPGVSDSEECNGRYWDIDEKQLTHTYITQPVWKQFWLQSAYTGHIFCYVVITLVICDIYFLWILIVSLSSSTEMHMHPWAEKWLRIKFGTTYNIIFRPWLGSSLG